MPSEGVTARYDKRLHDALLIFSLTEAEITIYLMLLSHGNMKTGELAKELDMQRFDVYEVLKGLQAKGAGRGIASAPHDLRRRSVSPAARHNS